jgi:hypothetical protein
VDRRHRSYGPTAPIVGRMTVSSLGRDANRPDPGRTAVPTIVLAHRGRGGSPQRTGGVVEVPAAAQPRRVSPFQADGPDPTAPRRAGRARPLHRSSPIPRWRSWPPAATLAGQGSEESQARPRDPRPAGRADS